MIKPVFVIKPPKPIKKPKSKIEKDVEGVVVEQEGKYYVRVDFSDIEGFEDCVRLLNITEDSYDTRGKESVWTKTENRYIRIIRFKDEAIVWPIPNAIPFRPTWNVKGDVIIEPDNKLSFRIKSCYPPNYGNTDSKT